MKRIHLIEFEEYSWFLN